MKYKIAVLYGSVRSARQGIRAAHYIINELEARDFDVTLIDPKETSLPLLDKMYKEYDKGSAPENMEKIAGILTDSDGFIVVTGEYNHGIPPALKNMLDHFQQEYFYKPSGIVSYSQGRFGGVRAAIQLRITLGELGSVSIPSILPIPSVHKVISEEGKSEDPALAKLTPKFLKEFEWYVSALADKRNGEE